MLSSNPEGSDRGKRRRNGGAKILSLFFSFFSYSWGFIKGPRGFWPKRAGIPGILRSGGWDPWDSGASGAEAVGFLGLGAEIRRAGV